MPVLQVFAKACSHYIQEHAQGASHEVVVFVDEARGLLGVPVAQWGDHQVMYSQKLLSRLSDKAVRSIHQSLMFHPEP